MSYQLVFCAALASIGAAQSVVAATNWVQRNSGNVPYDAVVYGYESNGARLYICRAQHVGGLHPGKVAPHLGACNIPYGGAEVAKNAYQVAVPAWEAGQAGVIPSRAVVASYEGTAPRFFCRAEHGGGLHPGKIGPGFGGCNIPYGGMEITKPQYEVLVRGDDKRYDDLPYRLTLTQYSGGNVPFDAIVGGREAGQNFYLCLGWHAGNWHPGKVRLALGTCNISYGGAEIAKNSYRVLQPGSVPSSERASWRYPVGYETGRDLFTCRAFHANGWHPGKTWIGLNACLIPYGGTEVNKPNYQLLDEPFPW